MRARFYLSLHHSGAALRARVIALLHPRVDDPPSHVTWRPSVGRSALCSEPPLRPEPTSSLVMSGTLGDLSNPICP